MRVFLTGASSGIGRALALELARRDPRLTIALVARRRAELERLAAELPQATVEVHPIDVTDGAALRAAGESFAATHGTPDVVIANAGISAGTLTEQVSDRDVFARILATNVVAMFDTFAPFAAAMRARRAGRLVGIASVSGIRGLPGGGAYCASKAAAISYLESLRVELHGSGVRVVTIAPGYIRTPMTAVNRFPMPFLMDADRFAARAADAIERGRSYVVIPWQMAIVAKLLRMLPNPLFDAAFARAPRKARPGDA
ncbi:MAG TPA: SDR family oxidoreductase [Burkholderiaceae bacterium]|nr:SDR family oxidoreductase [Burkholderiaceae bacterium]